MTLCSFSNVSMKSCRALLVFCLLRYLPDLGQRFFFCHSDALFVLFVEVFDLLAVASGTFRVNLTLQLNTSFVTLPVWQLQTPEVSLSTSVPGHSPGFPVHFGQSSFRLQFFNSSDSSSSDPFLRGLELPLWQLRRSKPVACPALFLLLAAGRRLV